MKGLSKELSEILDSFSTIEALKDYYLIGGTALSLQIQHRLSEDLDFCMWVPDASSAKHAVDPSLFRHELQNRFGNIQENHLNFSQVNFLIKKPYVKITFYHTDLNKPEITPITLLNNIKMADLKVLGGSKTYVITQRTTIRDFYDILVLLREKHTTLSQMLSMAKTLSADAKPKKIANTMSQVSFTQPEIDRFEALEPKYKITSAEYADFFQRLSQEIMAAQ
jgi:predicted nucleotidyltransferase component of viral defense system